MWFNLAAAQSIENAKMSKRIIEEEMTREQIDEDQRLAAEWNPVSER